MDPVDDIVTDVEGTCAIGQHVDSKRIFESCRFKGLGPPGRPFAQCGAHRLRRCGIDIEDNRLLHRAFRRCRIKLFQAEAVSEGLGSRRG